MPKQLNSHCTELVASPINYFEKERDNNGPLLPVTAHVAEALNLNFSTVSSISQAVKNSEVLKSSPKNRLRQKKVTNTKTLNTSAIRDVIYSMYEPKEHVSLDSLLVKLNDKELFNRCHTSLHTLLLETGFKWQKDEPRRGLMELPDIAVKRAEFLRKYTKENEANSYQFVFIDETWIFQNGTINRSWQDSNNRSVKSTKVDGKRYIILHSGNENGFIDGAEAIFTSKSNDYYDYHGEMNNENFLKWFEDQLLRRLNEPSLIVMDNASYHSTSLT